jgi:hypothetical protein
VPKSRQAPLRQSIPANQLIRRQKSENLAGLPLRPSATWTDTCIPHTYFRLPNRNVLATFQYRGGDGPKAEGGGLLEIDNGGYVLRSGSAEDGAGAGELIRPYSVVLLPAATDRVVSTNTAMHEMDEKAVPFRCGNSPACASCGRSRSPRVRVATSSTTPLSRA